MDSLRGVINSYLFREEMEVSFLQMLNGNTTQYEEEVDIGQNDNHQLQEQIFQHLQQEYNLCTHLKIQECYNNTIRNSAIDEQANSCITQKETNTDNVGLTVARKKRKRPRVPQPATAKNPEEMESQRMNHINVERNRRKLVNSHLNALRSIMPSSFVQRNDQASIVAGAIDFTKELEQHLQSLRAKKRHQANNEENMTTSSTASSSSTSNGETCIATAKTMAGFFISPQYVSYTENNCGVDVEATVVQGHVNLKILGKRNRGQLVRAVSALEQIGLMVMHLNVTTLDACSILYSLNLKIEEESKMRSADEIASVVHQIFGYIISTCCG